MVTVWRSLTDRYPSNALESSGYRLGRVFAACPLPDLAVLCTNASRNLALLEELSKGSETFIILSARHRNTKISAPAPCAITCACSDQTSFCGLLVPWQLTDASFSPVPIKRGKLAFIHNRLPSPTPSSTGRNSVMGFSLLLRSATAWISTLMNCLTIWHTDSEPGTILLYLEQLSDARRFVSAARSAYSQQTDSGD